MNQQPQDFDDLIRKRLGENAPPARPADGWKRLAEALDADPDHQLRTALSGLSLGDDPSGWERLERKMDPQSAADAAIAGKLKSLQPEVVAGSWATLSAKLDDRIGEEIDAVVVTQLNRDLAGASSGWACLAARLELIGQRRSIVAAWKITEVSLLLSLLLLFVRFGPEYAAPAPAIANQGSHFPMVINETPSAVDEEVMPAEPLAQHQASDRRVNVSNVRNREVVRNNFSGLTLPMPEASAGQPVADEVANPVSNIIASIEPVEPIASLDIRPLQRTAVMPSPALQLPLLDEAEPVRYYANFFASPFDFNQVITPANAIREIDISGDDRITRGLSFGALLDISQGKNGLQIGAIYSRRSYIPTALKWWLQEEYPLLEPVKGYSRFIYETISFPLSYQRTVRENDKWRISGRVGMNMTVIARSSFDIPTEDQELLVDAFNGRADLPGPPPSLLGEEEGRSRSSTSSGSSSRKLTNPDPGWLEGGSMLTNSSFYLGGGVQFERLLSPRWSVYVSPSFGRVIYLREKQGIGPYNDRIHTGSIRLGGRYLMSGK